MDGERKIERKRKRFAARLKTSKGIICIDTPSPNIVLCNVGQATGLKKELILKSVFGVTLPKYIAENGETHSFLVFNSTEEARLFFNNCNGKGYFDGTDTPVYMSFVENVPNMDSVCETEIPTGLLLLDDFISSEEEEQFLSMFDWPDDLGSRNLKNRQVKHYGYEFRYGTNDVDLSCPLSMKIPKDCDVLWKRLQEQGLDFGKPDQLTINKYSPGQGIPSHVDKHSPFGETILSLSLGSSVVMDWRHHSGKSVPVVLKNRSLLIMQGEARYDWQHGIQARTDDPVIKTRVSPNSQQTITVITSDTVARQTRISLTFRWTRSGPCQCVYKTLCDSVERTPTDIEDRVASDLEELHVHQVYEQIAGHFSATRHTAWPRVVQFVGGARPGDVVIDLGAGNGKNMLPRTDILQVCAERSEGLALKCICAARCVGGAADAVRVDALAAPLRDRCADRLICIAVIHHFSTQARRLQAVKTISRLLRPGGKALITVWAKDQKSSNYICKNKTLDATKNEQIVSVNGVELPVHENRTQFQHSDLLVPWKLRSKGDNKLCSTESTLLRYYHVFVEGELQELCSQLSDFEVEDHFYEEGNWCVICRKL